MRQNVYPATVEGKHLGVRRVDETIEIVRLAGAGQFDVLHTISHDALAIQVNRVPEMVEIQAITSKLRPFTVRMATTSAEALGIEIGQAV